MKSSQLELAISREQFKDHLETFLRAGGFIHDHQTITDIDLKGLHMKGPTDKLIPLTIGLKEEERMVLVEH